MAEVNRDWLDFKSLHNNIEGARTLFQNVCEEVLKLEFPNDFCKSIRLNRGDGGIDVFIGKIGVEPIEVYQCKFFLYEFDNSQHSQINKSFKTAINSKVYKIKKWILCVPYELDIKQMIWWTKWKDKQINEGYLNDENIKLIDGKELIQLIKKHNLYNKYFKIDRSLLPTLTLEEAKVILSKSSFNIRNIKSYLGNEQTKHLLRPQVQEIYNWIINDLPDVKLKNLLVVKGNRGMGKSVIMKDLYSLLLEQQIDVIGIKADKNYSDNRVDLEKKIFDSANISFNDILLAFNNSPNPLVIIIDQIDALSQTLSTKREYLNTYLKLISELYSHSKVRIIISSRIVDLDIDSDLSVFKKNEYTQIEITPFTTDEVKSILNGFNIYNYSQELSKLLQTPLHLDIFCKLPNKQTVNYSSLSTISDLYSELWKEIIVINSEYKCKELIYKVVEKMYLEQKITIPNIYDDEYSKEIKYLSSNGIVFLHNKDISFLHQSFYEFSVAKEFVESNKSIFEIVLSNEQSLYIRSIFKLVLEFLKERDYNSYLSNLQEIISNKKYLFHIKLLVIQSLALSENVSLEEYNIYDKYLAKNEILLEAFLSSTISLTWYKFLITNNKLNYFINENKTINNKINEFVLSKGIINKKKYYRKDLNQINEYRYSILFSLHIKFINSNSDLVLKYFDDVNEFSSKNNLLYHLLLNVENWENRDLRKGFEKMYEGQTFSELSNNYQYLRILKSIAKVDFEYTKSKLITILESIWNNSIYSFEINHNIQEVLKDLFEVDSGRAFEFIFMFYKSMEQKLSENSSPVNKKSLLYKSLIASGFFIPENTDTAFRFIEGLLLEYITNKLDDHELIQRINSDLKESNCISYLSFLIKIFFKSPLEYKYLGIDLINNIFKKNGFNSTDNELTFHIREYIKVTFNLLDELERINLIKIIQTIQVDDEIQIYDDRNNKRKYHTGNYGKHKYLFFKALPLEFIKENKLFFSKYLELDRKLKLKEKDQWRTGSIIAGAVRPPLPPKAYENMNIKSLILSMQKYNKERRDSFDFEEDDFLKGGMYEHSRAIEEQAKVQPNKFFELLEKIYNRNDIDITYISSCLNGLIEAKFNASKLFPYYKFLISKELDETETLYSVWKARYFIVNKVIDEFTFKYLAKLALSHPNPCINNSRNDLLSDSLNTIRSSAISKIIDCAYIENFRGSILEIVGDCCKDIHPSVRVSILHNIAHLIQIDSVKCFYLFKELIEKSSDEEIKYCFSSAQYFLYNYHQKMDFLFKRILNNHELHKSGGVMIILCWFYNYSGGIKYFDSFVQSSKEAKLGVLKIAEELIEDKKYRKKSIALFQRFMKEDDKDIAHCYSGFILRKGNKIPFVEINSLCMEYSKSELVKFEPNYFLKYLQKQATLYPSEVLMMIANMDFTTPPNIQFSGYYDKEPIQVIISIYSELYNRKQKDKKAIKISLNMFDEMLKIPHLRNTANNALENISQ